MATLTIADLDNGKRDLETVDAVANSQSDTTVTRYGDSVLTLTGALRRLGWQVPVAYAAGITVNNAATTVERDGIVYRPDPQQIPFTTGAWDPSQWRVIQNTDSTSEQLIYSSLSEASAAAATLPDGQRLEVEADSSKGGRRTRNKSVGGAVAFADFSPDTIRLNSYASLLSYAGPSASVDIFEPGVAGRFYYDASLPNSTDGVILFAHSSGVGAWKRQYTGPMRFEWFGVKGDGITLDDSAFAAAISYAGAIPGAQLSGKPGARYAISQPITVPFDGKFQDTSSRLILDFTGATIVPKTNNQIALKLCRDFVNVKSPTVETAATGVTAYYVGPETEGALTSIVSQQFCTIENPKAKGVRVGIKQIPGASVGAQTSGSYYNTYLNPVFEDVDLAIWLAGNPNALNNQNTRTFILNPRHVRGNCTFLIECADTLNVFGGSAEFINRGTFPLAVPTCIKIPGRFEGHTLDNRGLHFFAFAGETLGRPYAIESYETSLPNCTFSSYTVPPLVPLTPEATAILTTFDNLGAVRSVSDVVGKAALIGAKILGGNQAFLSLEKDAVAKFYSDTGFKTYGRFDADNTTTSSGSQYMGTDAAPIYLTGAAGVQSYRLVNTGAIEFGNATSIRTTSDNEATLGSASKRWGQIYSTQSTISTSDGREKTPLAEIDDRLLDAWGDVRIGVYKWLSSVMEKAEMARYHTGLIAQDVRDALISHGVMSAGSTVCPWGGLCYDEWPESAAVHGEEGKELLAEQLAGNRWGIRADQCLFLEAAYQRRRCDRIEARLDAAGL